MPKLTNNQRLVGWELSDRVYDDESPHLFKFGKGVEVLFHRLENQQVIYLAFRGSRGWYDWRRNLRFFAKASPFGDCHGGYLTEAVNNWKAVADHIPRNFRVILCCHSRGIMGQIFMAFILRGRKDLRYGGGIGFGVPKVWKGKVQNVRKIENCLNDKDQVTRAPWSIFGRPWHHHGPRNHKSVNHKGGDHFLRGYLPWVEY